MEQQALIQLITRSTSEGAQKALRQCPEQPKTLTKAQAYRNYGRSDTDRWITEGLIQFTGKLTNKADLERIAATSNRHTYLSAKER